MKGKSRSLYGRLAAQAAKPLLGELHDAPDGGRQDGHRARVVAVEQLARRVLHDWLEDAQERLGRKNLYEHTVQYRYTVLIRVYEDFGTWCK